MVGINAHHPDWALKIRRHARCKDPALFGVASQNSRARYALHFERLPSRIMIARELLTGPNPQSSVRRSVNFSGVSWVGKLGHSVAVKKVHTVDCSMLDPDVSAVDSYARSVGFLHAVGCPPERPARRRLGMTNSTKSKHYYGEHCGLNWLRHGCRFWLGMFIKFGVHAL